VIAASDQDRRPMLEAILWDNDGVLVDTEGLFFAATRAALARAGIELTLAQFVDIVMRRGAGVYNLITAPGWTPERIAALRRERNAAYAEMLRRGPDVAIAGVIDTLRALHGRLRMAVVTSSMREHFDLAHRRTAMAPFFETVVTREDYARSKPDPQPYLIALERLALTADRCVAVEDSERGLASARAAGLRCIVIPNALTRASTFAGAAAILDDVTQLPRAIAAL
jgi:HAD superfamily hydrolase (TIGR01509 family)